MNHNSRRLINHQIRRRLDHDPEFDRLGLQNGSATGLRGLNDRAFLHLIPRSGNGTVDQHTPFKQESCLVSADLQENRQGLVDSGAGKLRRHHQVQRVSHA